MRKNHRNGKRLRLIPLILGGYGAFLGSGLIAIGLAEIGEGVGIVRLLMGLGITGFGLLGIWDGVRDLMETEKKPETPPVSQFILTDTSGNRSSLVTQEVLREQIDLLAKSEVPQSFDLQILPPLSAGEHGLLKQILCIYHGSIILVAFFETPEDGYRIYQRNADPDTAAKWLQQLLAGDPDFSGWESVEINTQQDQDEQDDGQAEAEAGPEEEGAPQEDVEAFWHRLLAEQKGYMTNWRQLLVIYGESWHDDHKFFSARDVALAIEGIHEGKYRKASLVWGREVFDLFPGVQNDLTVIWCSDSIGKEGPRFLAKTGTVTQIKFWLVNYLYHGLSQEMGGWTDITAQLEKAKRKGEKKHGKVL